MRKFILLCLLVILMVAIVSLLLPSEVKAAANVVQPCEWHYFKIPGPGGYTSQCVPTQNIKNEPENLTIQVSKGECKIFGQNCFAALKREFNRHASGTVGEYHVTFYPANFFNN